MEEDNLQTEEDNLQTEEEESENELGILASHVTFFTQK